MGSLKIWTIGHGTRPVDELASMLRSAGVGLLIDVRVHPGSRRHPQFNRDALENSLGKYGIAYQWEGKALGGFRKPRPNSHNTGLRNESFRGYADYMECEEFAAGASRLIERARETRLAMMCAERHPSRCHRRLISDWLASREIEVEHLIDMRSSEPHVLTKGAVVAAGLLTYPGGVQPGLDIG
jgi:uncharacterized protein (DUF488 family)